MILSRIPFSKQEYILLLADENMHELRSFAVREFRQFGQ